MKKILVPVDFSEYSKVALQTADFLSTDGEAEITLIHVVNGYSEFNSLPSGEKKKYPDLEARITDSEDKLKKMVSDSELEGKKARTKSLVGVPHEAIINYARISDTDLVVMGAHGAGDSKNYIGSTAQQVVRKASCPVLSVKKDYSPKSVTKVTFACTMEQPVGDVIDKLINTTNSANAEISLLFVNTPSKFVDTKTIEERISDAGKLYRRINAKHVVYNDHSLENGILNYARESKADLLAMKTRNREGKPGYAIGVTEAILYRSEIPVWSLVESN